MRLLLMLLVVVCAGCGTDSPNSFFKPEVSGAVYAAHEYGDPTADDAREKPNEITKLELPNFCNYVPRYGWTCREDIVDENGVHQVADDDTYLAAPKFRPIASP